MTTFLEPYIEGHVVDAKRPLRVALAGCGVVGGELLRLLDRASHDFAARGRELDVVRVLVRDLAREREVPVAHDRFTDDVADFIATDADVVVEAIGGLEPATRIARAALARGAHFVTANKALVAAEGTALAALAAERGAALRFDAAVGGGVPALRIIDSALGASRPRSVRGILNGTSNFVLTLIERGATLDDALAEARRRGFAEADASRDLDGRDAADKLAIVAWRAFGVAPERVIVRRRGLLPDPERLVALAGAVGGRLRLVAECEQTDSGLVASVEPTVVAADSPLGRTTHEENRVEIDAGWSAPLSAGGPGAGGAPTATAILSDLLAPFESSRAHRPRVAAVADERRLRWLVEAPVEVSALVELFARSELPARAAGCGPRGSRVIVEAASWNTLDRALGTLDASEHVATARLEEGVA